jgi:hypothetical protein
MNRAFKVVWNALRRQFVVVNETQKSKKKSKSVFVMTAVVGSVLAASFANAGSILNNGTESETTKDFTSVEEFASGNVISPNYYAIVTTDNNTTIYHPANIKIESSWAATYSSGENATLYLGTDPDTEEAISDSLTANITETGNYYTYGIINESGASTSIGINSAELTVSVVTADNAYTGIAYTIFNANGPTNITAHNDLTINSVASSSYGIYNYNGPLTAQAQNVTIEAEGNTARGICNFWGSLNTSGEQSVELKATSSTNYALGLGTFNSGATTTITDTDAVKVTLSSDGGAGYGLDTESDATLSIKANSLELSVTASTYSFGIYNSDNATTSIDSSKVDIFASASANLSYGIVNYSGTVLFDNSSSLTITSKAAAGQGIAIGAYNEGTAVTIKDGGKVTLNAIADSSSSFGASVQSGAALSLKAQSLTINSTGAGALGVSIYHGSVESSTDNLSITATGKKSFAYDLNVTNNRDNSSTATFISTGKTALIATAPNSAYSINSVGSNTTVTGKEIVLSSKGKYAYGAIAEAKPQITEVDSENKKHTTTFNLDSTLKIGDSDTKYLSITATGEEEAFIAWAFKPGATLNLEAEQIELSSTTTSEGKELGNYGVFVQSNTQAYKDEADYPKTPATLNIKSSGTIAITSNGPGLQAFSNGVINVNGNLSVNALYALSARGNATVNINTENEDKTTVLIGDIMFQTPNKADISTDPPKTLDSQGSGNIINAYVTVNLNGPDSYWQGSSYSYFTYTENGQDVKAKHRQFLTNSRLIGYYDDVQDFHLNLNNGAQWKVTDDSLVNVITLKGKGNRLESNGHKIDIQELAFTDGSELITQLGAVYTNIQKDAKDVLTGADAAVRTVTVNGSASLVIEDKFTYSLAGLKALQADYETVNLILQNATLYVSPEELASKETKLEVGKKDVLTVAAGSVSAALPTLVSGTYNIITTANDDGTVNKTHKTEYTKIEKEGTFGVQAEVEAEELEVAPQAKVLVGTDDQPGKLTVSNLKLEGTLFLDPAWDSGQEASQAFITFENNETTGQVVVGRNSEMEIGADSDENLQKALSALGRKLDSSDLLAVARVNKALTLKGGSLVVDGTLTALPDSIAQGVLVEEGSALILNGEEGTGGSAVITSDGGAFTVKGELFVDNAKTDTTYTLASGFTEGVTADAEKIKAVSSLITLTKEESDAGTLVVSSKANEDLIKESIAPNTVNAVVSGAEGSGAERILSLYSAASGLTEKEATKALNTIALMGTASAAQAVAINSVNMINDTLDRHGSVLASYAHNKTGADLWIDLNGSFSKATRYQAGSSKYGFKSDLAGATIGADYALGNGVALGGAFSFGTGSARGQGNGAGIKNDIEYYGFNLYGAWNTRT